MKLHTRNHGIPLPFLLYLYGYMFCTHRFLKGISTCHTIVRYTTLGALDHKPHSHTTYVVLQSRLLRSVVSLSAPMWLHRIHGIHPSFPRILPRLLPKLSSPNPPGPLPPWGGAQYVRTCPICDNGWRGPQCARIRLIWG